MANTHYLILQLDHLENRDGQPGPAFFKPLGDIHSYSPGRACEEYARTQLHEAMLTEDGVTLVAVPAKAWSTVRVRAKQELKFDVQVQQDEPAGAEPDEAA